MDEFIKKLKEKYERGEISEETYRDILERYTKEVEQTQNGEKSVEVASEEGGHGDYKCSGSCTLGPGKYDHVSVAGSLKVHGNLEVETLSVAGSFHGEGDVRADSFRVAGSATIDGSIRADRINIAGSFRCKEIEGDSVKISGGLTAQKVSGDRVYIGGQVRCKAIHADMLEMKLSKDSQVELIEADTVEIRSERGLFSGCKGRLKAGRIVGDRVYVECTSADYVEGDKVVIGNGCSIGKLKAGSHKVAKDSKVKEVIREWVDGTGTQPAR